MNHTAEGRGSPRRRQRELVGRRHKGQWSHRQEESESGLQPVASPALCSVLWGACGSTGHVFPAPQRQQEARALHLTQALVSAPPNVSCGSRPPGQRCAWAVRAPNTRRPGTRGPGSLHEVGCGKVHGAFRLALPPHVGCHRATGRVSIVPRLPMACVQLHPFRPAIPPSPLPWGAGSVGNDNSHRSGRRS